MERASPAQEIGRGREGLVFIAAAALAVLAHIGLYRVLSRAHITPVAREEQVAVLVQWVEKPKPLAPVLVPAPVPEEKPAPKKQVKLARARPRLIQSTPVPAPRPIPAQPIAPPAPPPVGISAESTVAKSAVVIPAGNTLFGAIPATAPAPGGAQAGRIGRYVPYSQVSEPPVLLSEVKAVYPIEARKAGIAGEVVILLTIDDRGEVAQARELSGPGHGLDEAALGAVRQFRFRPARYNGAAVATAIRYIYAFNLN